MNTKKIVKIIISVMIIVSMVVLTNIINNKESKNESNKVQTYKNNEYIKKLKPISKASAINILKAEYGDAVSVSENEIKQVGDEYVVEVYVNFEDEDEHDDEQEEAHNTNLGIHKINIFTGEMIFPN